MKITSILLIIGLFSPSLFGQDTLVPLADFAALPTISSPKLSPNGQHILAISPIDGQETVVVAQYGSIEITPVIKLKKNQDRIEWARWANDSRILIYTTYPKVVYSKKIRIGRLFAVDINGKNTRELKLNKLMRHEQADLFSDLHMLSVLADDDKHILVQTYTGRDKSPAVFKFNIYNGDVEKTVSAANEIDLWVANYNGEVHLGIKYDYDKSTHAQTVDIYYRDDASQSEWDNIYSYQSFKDFYISPVAISPDHKTLTVFTDFGIYKDVLREFDLQKKEFGDIIFEVDGYDVDGAIVRDGKLVGVGYTDDYYRIRYFDETLAKRQKMIKSTFAQYQSYIVSSSKDKSKLIISASSSHSPEKYFLVDLNSHKAEFWLSQYAYLEKKDLPAKEQFIYTSRDDVPLNGYFTPGATGKNSPLIVFPHGGPGSRDTQHFDIWAQMLARRGYAVLQMNFRGSQGYGNDYETKGYKQWGKRMQEDVYDAIAWAKDNRRADTQNMCIVGASYGGYVALVAGYQQPDAFECIVSVAGVSDLPNMIEYDNFWDSYKVDMKERIGDVDNSDELADLKLHSAINHIDEFRAPVLLIHGENDRTVNISQSKNMYKALKKKHKKVTFLSLQDGTHQLDSPENRGQAFAAIDKFLASHL